MNSRPICCDGCGIKIQGLIPTKTQTGETLCSACAAEKQFLIDFILTGCKGGIDALRDGVQASNKTPK
jgi:hypothetical protein